MSNHLYKQRGCQSGIPRITINEKKSFFGNVTLRLCTRERHLKTVEIIIARRNQIFKLLKKIDARHNQFKKRQKEHRNPQSILKMPQMNHNSVFLNENKVARVSTRQLLFFHSLYFSNSSDRYNFLKNIIYSCSFSWSSPSCSQWEYLDSSNNSFFIAIAATKQFLSLLCLNNSY